MKVEKPDPSRRAVLVEALCERMRRLNVIAPEQALKEAPYEELRRISSQAAELLKLAEGEKETAQLKSVMISCAKIHRSRSKRERENDLSFRRAGGRRLVR